MPRYSRLLTARDVQDALRGRLKAGRYADGENLYLRVRKGGSCSWTFIAVTDGNKTEVSLGSVKNLGSSAGIDDIGKIASASLTAARDMKVKTHSLIYAGGDLSSLKKTKRSRVVVSDHTFDDLARVYEGLRGTFNQKRQQEVKRLVAALREAAPEVDDIRLFTKAHARIWRDGRRSKVSALSVERENNVIKSMFSVYFSENDFHLDNPFSGLKMPEKAIGSAAISKRSPLSIQEIQMVREQLVQSSREPEITQIWDVLTMTGGRMAEIQGLRMQDVHLDGPIPHIRITPSDKRGVKTAESIRWVPLYGIALTAAQAAAKRNASSDFLFGKQGHSSAGNVSAKIMKQFRKQITDPEKVTYSLRHSLIDEFRAHGVATEIAYPFSGHTSGDIAEKVYGSRERQLNRTNDVVKPILETYSDRIFPPNDAENA
ncbi:integrase family protein [Paracoccus caeni]|uniref:Integrase family protein n=1 Tax=Paracoccus caeni TaxID=657651 RepID=A0A934W073_9RHOB|nr:integrase family protein [Paracoccus caeni]MBK4216630.1 integrase family protein [Paracoccus caeni]